MIETIQCPRHTDVIIHLSEVQGKQLLSRDSSSVKTNILQLSSSLILEQKACVFNGVTANSSVIPVRSK